MQFRLLLMAGVLLFSISAFSAIRLIREIRVLLFLYFGIASHSGCIFYNNVRFCIRKSRVNIIENKFIEIKQIVICFQQDTIICLSAKPALKGRRIDRRYQSEYVLV